MWTTQRRSPSQIKELHRAAPITSTQKAPVDAPGLNISHLPYAILYFGLGPIVLLRFGLLPMIRADLVGGLLFLVSTNFSAWYAPNTYVALALILAMTAYSFYTGLGGRRLYRDEMLG